MPSSNRGAAGTPVGPAPGSDPPANSARPSRPAACAAVVDCRHRSLDCPPPGRTPRELYQTAPYRCERCTGHFSGGQAATLALAFFLGQLTHATPAVRRGQWPAVLLWRKTSSRQLHPPAATAALAGQRDRRAGPTELTGCALVRGRAAAVPIDTCGLSLGVHEHTGTGHFPQKRGDATALLSLEPVKQLGQMPQRSKALVQGQGESLRMSLHKLARVLTGEGEEIGNV